MREKQQLVLHRPGPEIKPTTWKWNPPPWYARQHSNQLSHMGQGKTSQCLIYLATCSKASFPGLLFVWPELEISPCERPISKGICQ